MIDKDPLATYKHRELYYGVKSEENERKGTMRGLNKSRKADHKLSKI